MILAELIENRIIVWNIKDSRSLYKEAYYGKPLGIPKPKDFYFNAPLILDLLESYYLLIKGKIKVLKDGKELKEEEMLKICEKEYVNFREKFLVYTKLKEKGFIVTAGIKFGSDFAVYHKDKGPGKEHAPYLVKVMKPSEKIDTLEIVLAGRLATTVRKQFTIAVADIKSNSVDFIGFDWWRA
ncbi:MAG: tRNA-intron lyase [Nitrososphaerales archaeon]